MTIFKTPAGTELPLLNLRGQDYLEVKYRLVWFREQKPGWAIETNPVELTASSAYFRAVIKDETGRIVATAHKFEDKQGFSDFREKSETSAIGRALALVGFGTQFCADDLNEGDRIVDSPIANRLQHAAKSMQPHAGDGHQVAHETGPYRVGFGKHAKKGLHEIPEGELADYCDYLERTAAKEGKPMRADAVELVTKAREFLKASSSEPWDTDPFVK